MPTAGAHPSGGGKTHPKGVTVEDLAIESAIHPSEPAVAFTSLSLGDGYQLYVAHGVESVTDSLHVRRDIRQLSQASAGVHGVHWISETELKYSLDGRTLLTQFDIDGPGRWTLRKESTEVLADRPLPVHEPSGPSAQVDIPYPIDCKSGGSVCCTDIPWVTDLCVRLTASDSGHAPECDYHNPPPMPHGHFAIFPEGNYRAGVNMWIGKDGRCIWIGEEHYTNDDHKDGGYCKPICGPDGELPSLTTLKEEFEDVIDRALDSAGIAVPAIVVTALAYYLAASTLAPPTGVPLV